jgi:hypothetical protein
MVKPRSSLVTPGPGSHNCRVLPTYRCLAFDILSSALAFLFLNLFDALTLMRRRGHRTTESSREGGDSCHRPIPFGFEARG